MLKRSSCNTPFKPPFKKDKSGGSDKSDPAIEKQSSCVSEEDIASLKAKERELIGQIESLKEQGYSTEKLTEFIAKLHEYNELKDIGQTIFGQIAAIEGVPIRSLYEKYGLNLDD